MFIFLSSLEKPSPLERLVRTTSPSKTSTRWPLSRSSFSTISLMVVLPDPESPVNHKVNPRPNLVSFSMLFFFTSCLVYSLSFSACKPSMRTSTTSERLNSGGGYSPLESISRTFVPERRHARRGRVGRSCSSPSLDRRGRRRRARSTTVLYLALRARTHRICAGRRKCRSNYQRRRDLAPR